MASQKQETNLVFDNVGKCKPIFTARCNARKRCTSYSNSVRLSVCLSARPSVTRRYCVKMTARSTVQFALSAKCV